jgi:hypothetical protein
LKIFITEWLLKINKTGTKTQKVPEKTANLNGDTVVASLKGRALATVQRDGVDLVVRQDDQFPGFRLRFDDLNPSL